MLVHRINDIDTPIVGGDILVDDQQIGYTTLLLWSEEERNAVGVFTMPDPPAPPPVAIDFRQAELKLLSEPHELGTRLDAVQAYIATQPRAVQIEWSRARELRRDHPMVGIMGIFFGLSSADLDQWFIEASQIGPTVAL